MSQETKFPDRARSQDPDVWNQAFRRAFASRPFVVAFCTMLFLVAGVWGSTLFLDLKFRKQPVPLQRDLTFVERHLGHWMQVSDDEPLEADVEQSLGTKQYIFRDYVDTRLVGPQEIEDMLSKPTAERRRLVSIIEQRKPRAVIHLGVTYYTGMVDTVAHVPDRCYIADGYAPTDYETRSWTIGKMVDAKGKTVDESVDVRLICFEDATGFTSRVPKNVAYLFQVNGAMESNPAMVRFRLQNLLKADIYYAKIELMMTYTKDRKEVEKVMTDFLANAMPEVRKCLPLREGAAKVAAPEPTTKPASTGL